jgi:hypothetical protein
MAGLLKAQFACYVRVNFDPAFHKNPAFQNESGFPYFFPAWKKAYQMVRSQSMV